MPALTGTDPDPVQGRFPLSCSLLRPAVIQAHSRLSINSHSHQCLSTQHSTSLLCTRRVSLIPPLLAFSPRPWLTTVRFLFPRQLLRFNNRSEPVLPFVQPRINQADSLHLPCLSSDPRHLLKPTAPRPSLPTSTRHPSSSTTPAMGPNLFQTARLPAHQRMARFQGQHALHLPVHCHLLASSARDGPAFPSTSGDRGRCQDVR